MAISDGYATLAEFKLWKDIGSTDSDDDAVIEDCIEAASRYIDRATGRTFYARTETHYFDVPDDGDRLLRLDDDLLTITTLTNGDSTVITSTHYNLVPKNYAPYYGIKLKAASTYYWTMDSSGNVEDVISLAGTWGFSATAPDDIKDYCLALANNLYQKRHGEGQQVAVITGAGVVISPSGIPKDVVEGLRAYKRRI